MVNGVQRLTVSYPTCKSVEVMRRANVTSSSPVSEHGNDWTSVIDEDVRLLLQIETLFPLAPASWLYGTSDEDHV